MESYIRPMRYPNSLRAHRLTRQITQEDVARATDIRLNRYGRMEAGHTKPSLAEGIRLAEFFGVEPTALLAVSDDADGAVTTRAS